MEDIIEKCCNIVSWHVRFFKREIEMSQDKKIKLDMRDMSKLICSDTIIDAKHSEEICQNLKDIFSNKGINATIGEYNNGEKFLIMRNEDIKEDKYIARNTHNVHKKDKTKSFKEILRDNKLFDDDTRYLLCPECNRYSVEYSTSSYREYDKKWWCNNCLDVIIYYDYGINISDKDKYHIYKFWGAEALSIFTNISMKKTIGFVASYFKNCCITKKDRCLYFDFFNEKGEKEGKDGKDDVEGDVIDERSKERSKMVTIRRNAKGK